MTVRTGRRAGVRIGVDVGTVRVGLAVSDPEGILATPLATLTRDQDGTRDLDELAALVAEHGAIEVVVGNPLHLSGVPGAAAVAAREYADALRPLVAPVPVVLADERLTTVTAERQLAERGLRGRA
ncbi:MAG: Holliday junction resolvase RuvX, partial [Frankia sp.]|nr:Holliday junction resolvase RuvX [Frankia sp.]